MRVSHNMTFNVIPPYPRISYIWVIIFSKKIKANWKPFLCLKIQTSPTYVAAAAFTESHDVMRTSQWASAPFFPQGYFLCGLSSTVHAYLLCLPSAIFNMLTWLKVTTEPRQADKKKKQTEGRAMISQLKLCTVSATR